VSAPIRDHEHQCSCQSARTKPNHSPWPSQIRMVIDAGAHDTVVSETETSYGCVPATSGMVSAEPTCSRESARVETRHSSSARQS
jgi:hypothetical protein